MIKFIKNNIIVTILILLATGLIYYFFTRETSLEVRDKANHHYVNNIYLSDDYVYNQLDNSEKQAYDYIFNLIKNGKFKNRIKNEDLGCEAYDDCYELLTTVHDALIVEQPDLINYSNFMGKFYNDEIDLQFFNAMPFKFISEIGMLRIERMLDDIKRATKDMSDTEKVLYVYEWIGDHATYDRDFMLSSKNQSIYNMFIKKNAVCAGFGKAAAVIFQNIGIEAHGVTGFMDPADPIGHMWDIVKIDGKYYYFDSTWAASINDKNDSRYYYGLNRFQMASYRLDHPEWYPEISEEEIPNLFKK